ncbi:DNA binding domain-containing protein, excisionase family [Algoriella xinjiangensis]|uniref:DNA binding domain-containing protein, excisionase family n=1 Tax=Algoriella xinjiangensis TaxID=684065 RepID=A0A1I4YVV8_9FLAO|nr:helix-turn-helix domain-containing protein [Algoriella xinjiangensis]SFN42131.1 DNA binding domain-containing protein, excisionase family [Algoriella xinjiangensis]
MTYFLSLNEALEYLKVSKATLYKLTSNREIKFYKPNGGKIYFKVEDLENWISSGEKLCKHAVFQESLDFKSRKNGE